MISLSLNENILSTLHDVSLSFRNFHPINAFSLVSIYSAQIFRSLCNGFADWRLRFYLEIHRCSLVVFCISGTHIWYIYLRITVVRYLQKAPGNFVWSCKTSFLILASACHTCTFRTALLHLILTSTMLPKQPMDALSPLSLFSSLICVSSYFYLNGRAVGIT